MSKSNQLGEIVERDIATQNRGEERDDNTENLEEYGSFFALSGGTSYELAPEGVEEASMEEAIQDLNEPIDVYDEYNAPRLSQLLGLRERNEDPDRKHGRVLNTVVRALKRARRFREKVYTPSEIESILIQRGICVDGKQIIKNGFNYWCNTRMGRFERTFDNEGNVRYKLDTWMPDSGE